MIYYFMIVFLQGFLFKLLIIQENLYYYELIKQKTEANLEDLKNEIVKIHPYKVQYLEYKNQNDAREVEMVGIKRELRELMDKIVVLESAREAFFVERRNNTSLIQKLKLELEIFQSENSGTQNRIFVVYIYYKTVHKSNETFQLILILFIIARYAQ
jgi:hypothetical protein